MVLNECSDSLLVEQGWEGTSLVDSVWSCVDPRDFDSSLFGKAKNSECDTPSSPPSIDDDVWCAQAVAAALAATADSSPAPERLAPPPPPPAPAPSLRPHRSPSPALKRRLQRSGSPARGPACDELRAARRVHQLTCVKLQAAGSDLRRATLLRNTARVTDAEVARLRAPSPAQKRACLEGAPPDPASLPSPHVLTEKERDDPLPALKPDRSADMDVLVASLLRFIADE